MHDHGLHHPLLSVAPDELRPTQASVGMAEVRAKRAQWRKLGRKKRRQLLASHWFPGVLGPRDRVYIVDHHHLGLALLDEGVDDVSVMIQRDFSMLDAPAFWRTMEFYRWAHPYDANGWRTGYDAIPERLRDLQDDPYRTLAMRVRVAGGCAKDTTPYAEFLWADFYRARIRLRGDAIGKKVLQRALLLAHGQSAAYLPGWSGASE